MIFRLLTALALLFAPASVLAEWRIAETDHFTIYSERDPASIEKLAAQVESFDKLMRMATSVPDDKPAVKVRILEVADLGEVQKAADVDDGIGGFYHTNILGPFLVTPRKTTGASKDFTPDLVLHHEYAHHFMLQYFPAVYPSWYVEGFAELVGSSKMLDDGRIGYGMPAKARGHEILAYWVPLQEVLTQEKPWGLDRYGQGWAMTHFFTFDKARAGQFRQYLKALTDGKSPKEAAQVFGGLARLNSEARRYVGKGHFEYRPVAVAIQRPAVRSLRPASPGEADLIIEMASFRDDDLNFIKKPGWRERERRFRERTLKAIRDKATRHPRDASAQYILGEAENAAGNWDAAETAIDRALAIRPNHVRAMARKSELLARKAARLQGPARAAAIAAARRLAIQANKLDPSDPLPLVAFFQTFELVGEAPTGHAVIGLKQAVETFPLDTNFRQLLVNELADHGFYAQAIEWLQPIANDPHDSPRRDAAREQREKLRAALARQRGTVSAPRPTS